MSVHLGFASDNYAPAHSDVLNAVNAANAGFAIPYGDDPWTAELRELVQAKFGNTATCFPVFNGTAANVVSLLATTPRWRAVATPASSHTITDEGGAGEHIAGLKFLPIPAADGRLTPELLNTVAHRFDDVHHSAPGTVSIANTTELGTVYSIAAMRAVTERAHEFGLLVHLDGARIWNAAAALGVTVTQLIAEAGVDIASIGATKVGALGAELIVVLNPEIAGMPHFQKLTMQLPSKQRYLAAQLLALFHNDLGLTLGAHGNAMAHRLRTKLEDAQAHGHAAALQFVHPTEANAVIATLPAAAQARLRQHYRFYDWNTEAHEVRWMTNWATTADDVDTFAEAIIDAAS